MSTSATPNDETTAELAILRARVRELEAEQRRFLGDDPSRVLVELSRSAAMQRGNIDSALSEIAQAAAGTLSVDRVGIWLFSEDRSSIECHDLFREDIGEHERGLRLTAADYPRYFEALEQNRTIAAHDARTDPRTSEFASGYLEPLGITSMLDAPVRLDGHPVGIVCHEHIGPPRHWSPSEQAFAASIADSVALVLRSYERWQAENTIRASERRLRHIIDLVPHMIFAKDRQGRFLLANRATAAAYDMTVEALFGQEHDELHPDGTELNAMRTDDRTVIESGEEMFIPEEPFTDSRGNTRILQTIKIPFIETETNEPGVLGVAIDITEQKAAERRQTLMVRELDHRVKNNLTTILSIAEQTIAMSDSLEMFADRFEGRVRALASAHEALADRSWEGAEIGELAKRMVVDPQGADRVRCQGEEILVPSTAAPIIAMVLHELAVNSAKYGSLSVPEGTVTIDWHLEPGDPARNLALTWREHGGPPVQPPARAGFGTQMIEHVLSYQLRGDAKLEFNRDGVECRLSVPLHGGDNSNAEST